MGSDTEVNKERIELAPTYGRWTVLGPAPNLPNNRRRVYVRCSCGTEKVVRACTLYSGTSTSCGCYRKELEDLRRQGVGVLSTIHGESVAGRKTLEYQTYTSVRSRHPNLKKRWASYQAFLKEVGRKPGKNWGFDPFACKWIRRMARGAGRRPDRNAPVPLAVSPEIAERVQAQLSVERDAASRWLTEHSHEIPRVLPYMLDLQGFVCYDESSDGSIAYNIRSRIINQIDLSPPGCRHISHHNWKD